MNRSIYIFLLVLLLIPPACTFRKERLDRLWFFAYSTGINGNDKTGIAPGSFMELKPDKSYTSDFGNFDYGHWEITDTLLLLESISGNTASFPIKYLSADELQVLTVKGVILNFESQPGKFSSVAEDPFSVENNKWRLSARKKEDDAGLKTRLRNHCRFYEFYFRWALENSLNSIDVRSTPSLIKIYGNGFTLKEFDELPPAWRSNFYDEEDCHKANEIMRSIFKHSDIAWTHTDNKYKMFISAFQQLQQLLE